MDEDHDLVLRPIEGYFQDLATAQTKPPFWIIEGLIPKGITFIAGPPKSGKSTLTMAIAALLAGWECSVMPKFMSKVVTPGNVLWLSAEADAGEILHTMKEELDIQGITADESIIIADDPWMFRLDDPGSWAQLHEWLEERKPRLTIIDPLAEFHELEEKDAGEMVRLLRPIRKWAVDNDRSVVFVHHTGKKAQDQRGSNYSVEDVRGSSAIFGKADGLILLTPKGKKEEQQAHIQTVFKRGKSWDKVVMFSAYEQKKRKPGIAVPADMAKKVVTLMSLGARTFDDLMQQANSGPAALRDTIAALEENGVITRVGADEWELKKLSGLSSSKSQSRSK